MALSATAGAHLRHEMLVGGLVTGGVNILTKSSAAEYGARASFITGQLLSVDGGGAVR